MSLPAHEKVYHHTAGRCGARGVELDEVELERAELEEVEHREYNCVEDTRMLPFPSLLH